MLTIAEKRKIWLKFAEEHKDVQAQMQEDIEAYRKGYCKLRFVDCEGKPVAGKKVKINQTGHDFKYGANIFMLDEFGDDKLNTVYRDSFKKYFNLATVPFYWDGLEPEQGKPRFAKDSPKIYRRPAPELCVEYCEENGVTPKLHCLVYDKFIPDWLPKTDMAAMEKMYEKRFREIAERYSGRLMEFEVINELMLEAGWTNKSVISEKKDIIEWSFGLARKYLPDETLVINEGNPIIRLAKEDYRHTYYMMVENALLKGAEIDKVGLQHHCFTGAAAQTAEDYENAVKSGSDMFDPCLIRKGLDYAETLGLPLEITEITVPTFGDTEEDELLQADLLELLYTAFFSHRAVDTAVYWNLPDGYAYVAPGGSTWNENACRGGLFHHDMTPKKSAERMWELFNKKWHTEEELVTDQNGYVEFRGFYGDYEVEADGDVQDFDIHKSCDNTFELIV